MTDPDHELADSTRNEGSGRHRSPLIGITCSTIAYAKPGKQKAAMVFRSYTSALQEAGAATVLIPSGMGDEGLATLVARLDGLLLPGGGDVHPIHYSETISEKLRSIDEERDALELELTKWALDHDLPLLAICRGIQVLNVAAGGSLYQDLEDERSAGGLHDRPYPRYHLYDEAHNVQVLPGSRLAALLGVLSVTVNSRHHQAVRDLGEGLMSCASAPDRVIEALESSSHRFVVGVQWHPENLLERCPPMSRLFSAFVTEAGQ